jgi:hypothetical protein
MRVPRNSYTRYKEATTKENIEVDGKTALPSQSNNSMLELRKREGFVSKFIE